MAGERTAVLMVHGMGNQRPLATVRAIVKALYGDVEPQPGDSIPRRWWTKLDRDVGDIDLPVIVTATVGTVDAEGKSDTRVIDFHECYWASEMAESRLAAVPMWLFELVRKGPSGMQRNIRALWFIFGGLLAFWILCGCLALLTLLIDWVGDLPTGTMAVALPWGGGGLALFFHHGLARHRPAGTRLRGARHGRAAGIAGCGCRSGQMADGARRARLADRRAGRPRAVRAA